MLNPAITALAAPPVAQVLDWAAVYDGKAGPLIDLSQAVPGYPPHPQLIEALATSAADQASFGYGAIEGEDSLRQAYAAHVSRLYGTTISPAQSLITAGCNQGFIIAALAVAAAGEKIALPLPCYFNHASSLAMLGIGCSYVETRPEDGFLPRPEALRAAISSGIRAFALVSPNNPTGAIWPASLLAELLAICRDHGCWMIIDETYRDFLPVTSALGDTATAAREPPPHALFATDWQDCLIQLYSFSKAYCLPGQRLGAVIAGQPVITEMAKIMDNIQICAPRAGQHAVAGMISQLDDWRQANRLEMARRARAFHSSLEALDDWVITSAGAYFGFVRHPFSGQSSLAVAERMLHQAGVLTLPGDFFAPADGGPAYPASRQHIRFAFANAGVEAISQLGERLQHCRHH